MPLQDSDIFLVTKADGSESRHIRAANLFSGVADDWNVLINENEISKRCLVSELLDKASDDRYMLVQSGDQNYKVKSSTVVSQYGPPLGTPITSKFSYSVPAIYSGIAATFNKSFSSIQPTALTRVLPTDNQTVNFSVPIGVPAGSTLIVSVGGRTESTVEGTFSMSDSKGNTYTSVIQGTQNNLLTFPSIFMADINAPLITSDTITLTTTDTVETSRNVYGCLYVIDSQGVQVVDTADFRMTLQTTNHTLDILAESLTVAMTATGAARDNIMASNPDFTSVDIDGIRVGNSTWAWYLVGTTLGNGTAFTFDIDDLDYEYTDLTSYIP